MRFLGRFINAKVAVMTVDLDLCTPTVSVPRHPEKPVSVTALDTSLVLLIHTIACLAQIRPCVVGLNTVDMVELVRGPASGHDQKRNAMSQILPPVNANVAITIGLKHAPRNVTRTHTEHVAVPAEPYVDAIA